MYILECDVIKFQELEEAQREAADAKAEALKARVLADEVQVFARATIYFDVAVAVVCLQLWIGYLCGRACSLDVTCCGSGSGSESGGSISVFLSDRCALHFSSCRMIPDKFVCQASIELKLAQQEVEDMQQQVKLARNKVMGSRMVWPRGDSTELEGVLIREETINVAMDVCVGINR